VWALERQGRGEPEIRKTNGQVKNGVKGGRGLKKKAIAEKK